MEFRYNTSQKPAVERKVPGNTSRSIAFGIALAAFSPMVAGPMEQTAYAQQAKYNSKTDPFAPDARITEIAASLKGSDLEKTQAIFDKLHRGAPGGVKVVSGEHRAPRTASETLDDGGDCTDLANLAISALKEAGVNVRAMIVHFSSAPADTDHMVPYILDGDKVIIDLQTGKLGATAQGRYTVVMDLSSDQAREMYHREWAEYLLEKGKTKDAIGAFERSLGSYEADAHVHQNLGIAYEKAGDMAKSSKHFKRAAELDPRYSKDEKRGSTTRRCRPERLRTMRKNGLNA